MNHHFFLTFFIVMIITIYSVNELYSMETPSKVNDINGYISFHKGDFVLAAKRLKKNLSSIDINKHQGQYLDTLSQLVDTLYILGYLKKALLELNNARSLILRLNDRWRIVQYLNQLAMIHYALGNNHESTRFFQKAHEEALKAKHPVLIAHVMNNIGNCLVIEKDYDQALIFYYACLDLLEQTDDNTLKTIVLVNLFRIELRLNVFNDNYEQIFNIANQINKMPDSHQKAVYLITMSRLIEDYQINEGIMDAELFNLSYLALHDAKEIGSNFEDNQVISNAYGYLGRLYEMNDQYEEAKTLTMRAIFFATQGKYPELLYRWQWQMGKQHMFCDDFISAKKYFRLAISTVNPIRLEFFGGFRNHENAFKEHIKPLYTDLTELLITEATQSRDEITRKQRLKEAITVMELLKTAELQDFFEDECTVSQNAPIKIPDRANQNTAIIYPIVLPHFLALLIIMPDGIHHVKIDVDAQDVFKTVEQYRKDLQIRTTHRFLYNSWKLYDWVIRPLEKLLKVQKIDTLIFAPDGVLRLVPLSTLHDGKKFLVENYAIGLIPAIRLTQTQNFNKTDIQILINGLSEARQGFSPLPSVKSELRDIKKMFNRKHVLSNNQYTIDNLTIEFTQNNYNIIHIATHGIFAGKKTDSFLLTYNSKLNMDQLESLIGKSIQRNHTVDLLTLSACQTALGNERAALGLAGVAVKAGVKSVVATLWYVDDEATSIAIREFYRQLMTPGLTKAKALQNTQKKLIANPRFWQPLYWAPFLLIGNWM